MQKAMSSSKYFVQNKGRAKASKAQTQEQTEVNKAPNLCVLAVSMLCKQAICPGILQAGVL